MEADEEVVESGAGGFAGEVGEVAGFVGGLELGAQALELGSVEGDVGVFEFGFFGTGQFAGDEFVEIGEPEPFVKVDEVSLHPAGMHEVDAGEEDAVDAQEGADAARAFSGEEVPLGFGEAEVAG